MTTTTIVRRLAVPALLIAGGAANATAGVTDQISFQARLIDDAGNPVSPGIHELDFHFFAEAEGGQPVGSVPNVEVQVSDDGVVSTAVGPVDSSWFAGTPRYLGITVDDDDDDPFGDELSPRIMLTAVPWALRALDLPAWTSISVQSGAFSEDVSVEGRVTVGGAPDHAGQLSLYAGDPSASNGLAWHGPFGTTGRAYLKPDGTGDTNWYLTRGGDDMKGIVVGANGNVGIQCSPTTRALELGGELSAPTASIGIIGSQSIELSHQNPFIDFHTDSTSEDYTYRLQSYSGNLKIRHLNNDHIMVFDQTGRVGIGVESPTALLEVAGTTSTHVLQITGGSDIVERFMWTDDPQEPGTLVSIDPLDARGVRRSATRYDRLLVGVISGAGGVNPGICLSQEGTLDGEALVAVSGRVYVRCSTENGPIGPGDLITSGGCPGVGMRAADPARAFGAVVGKAMSSLDEGTGLVLVLVNLQ